MPSRTRTRLLDEAERLFAVRGFEACSIRDLISAARANLGAVTYHFGSKKGLLRAVIERRLRPLNEERLRRLEEAEAVAGTGGPELEEILAAAIAPTIRLLREKPNFMRLIGRLLTTPGGFSSPPPEAKELLDRFMRAISRAVPGVPTREIAWRAHFLRGALIHTWTAAKPLVGTSTEGSTLDEGRALVARLVSFGAAGLRAPLPGSQARRWWGRSDRRTQP
ncbi:MAG TPA: TetR/AcrR family transcriptional regulator [Planctomycetota bacterium]|nr:TetR/AcrR family transcriptional regulator [Planctomycetota bacterium]